MSDETTTKQVRVKKPAAVKVLNMEAAMKDAQIIAAAEKPKKAKKQKPSSEEIIASAYSEAPFEVVVTGGEKVMESTLPSGNVVRTTFLQAGELVIDRPKFRTDAPYTVIVRGQTGSRLVEEKSLDWALQTAKEAHAATGRRVSILRPGMKAVHLSNVEAFYTMRLAEEAHASAAGQARADALRASQPTSEPARPRFQRRDGNDYSNQDVGMGRTLHL